LTDLFKWLRIEVFASTFFCCLFRIHESTLDLSIYSVFHQHGGHAIG